jgi:steroid delta-isomerase-like uncharacterized protein
MTIQSPRDLVAEYIEKVWNRGDLAALEELTTPAFAYRLGEQPPRDRTAMRQFLAATRAAFPDWRVETTSVIVEGNLAAARWRGTVTHQGDFYGMAATGRRIGVGGINMYRIEAGKIAEEWEQTDSLAMLRQLGALPAV